jgi:hypothetical protein
MSLETRTRHATDGARASIGGVDSRAALDVMLRRASARRRASRIVPLCAVVLLVAGGAWLVTADLTGAKGAPPPTMQPNGVQPTPSHVPTAPVGAGLQAGLMAEVPAGWEVYADGRSVELGSASTVGPILSIGELAQVFDPRRHRPVAPPADYVDWLRHHPWLEVLEDTTVEVDGNQVPELTLRVRDDARTTGDHPAFLHFGRLAGESNFDTLNPTRVFRVVELPVGDRTVVVTAYVGLSALDKDQTFAALDELLGTIRS